MGVLGWSPTEFWASTLYDVLPALDGYLEKNGGAPKPAEDAEPRLTGRDIAAALRSHPNFKSTADA